MTFSALRQFQLPKQLKQHITGGGACYFIQPQAQTACVTPTLTIAGETCAAASSEAGSRCSAPGPKTFAKESARHKPACPLFGTCAAAQVPCKYRLIALAALLHSKAAARRDGDPDSGGKVTILAAHVKLSHSKPQACT